MCNWIHQKDHHRHNHCPRHNTNPKEYTCHCANTEIALRYTLLSLRKINNSELNTTLALASQKGSSYKREARSCSKVGYVNFTIQGKALSSCWNRKWRQKHCQQNQPNILWRVIYPMRSAVSTFPTTEVPCLVRMKDYRPDTVREVAGSKPRLDQPSGSLNSRGESAAFGMTFANG